MMTANPGRRRDNVPTRQLAPSRASTTLRNNFDVSDDQVPYVAMIDATGKVLWRGHGSPASLSRS